MKKSPKKGGPARKRKLAITPTKSECAGDLGLAGGQERAGTHSGQTKYVLRLYVSGSTLKSARAVENIKRVCEQYLKNRYDLEVIDIYQQANLARGEQIVAVPTLIKRLPLPLRRLIGDLSNTGDVLLGLDLKRRG
ncbi:MAG: thiol-disulfide isomerase [Acidobacteria bacterium]|nr:thiol-disulfide isomerase [Acidobacteriota bacterium]